MTWREWATHLRAEVYAVSLTSRDPRVPWYARSFAACVVAYAFSPIDLIPDFIPVIGHLDDLLIVPLGIALTLKMIPPEVMAECRQRADASLRTDRPTKWLAAGIVVAVWLLLASLAIRLL